MTGAQPFQHGGRIFVSRIQFESLLVVLHREALLARRQVGFGKRIIDLRALGIELGVLLKSLDCVRPVVLAQKQIAQTVERVFTVPDVR